MHYEKSSIAVIVVIKYFIFIKYLIIESVGSTLLFAAPFPDLRACLPESAFYAAITEEIKNCINPAWGFYFFQGIREKNTSACASSSTTLSVSTTSISFEGISSRNLEGMASTVSFILRRFWQEVM